MPGASIMVVEDLSGSSVHSISWFLSSREMRMEEERIEAEKRRVMKYFGDFWITS